MGKINQQPYEVLQKVQLKLGCCFVNGLDLGLDKLHTFTSEGVNAYGHVDLSKHLCTLAGIHQCNVLRCGDDHST